MAGNIDPEAFRRFERTAHDGIAESYHEHFASLSAVAVDPLLTAATVGEGADVLEVAAGSGVLAAAAVRRGAGRVLATDISPGMISLAARLHPSIEFLEADVEHLPLASATFDSVICNFGLGHFPDPRCALAECVRVLRDGGRLAFSWWDKPERQRFQGLFIEAMAEAGAEPPADLPLGPPMFHYSEDRNFARLLRSAGLGEVSISTHGARHRVGSVEALWQAGLGSLARTGAVVKAQSVEVQDAIKAALGRLAEPYLRGEALEIPISFKIGSGSKI